MDYISPSKIAVTAALKSGLIQHAIPATDTATEKCICGRCGAPINIGDEVVINKPGKSFNDWTSMADRFSPYLCAFCPTLNIKGFILGWGNSLATEDGLMRLVTIEERAWAILNPPTKPYVMVLINAKQQHLFWRAPVNYSSEIMHVRYGNIVLTVNRPLVLGAYEKIRNAGMILNAANGKSKRAKHPFLMLSTTIGRPAHAIPHYNLNDEGEALIDSLGPLSAGDTWALANLLSANQDLLNTMAGYRPHTPKPTDDATEAVIN